MLDVMGRKNVLSNSYLRDKDYARAASLQERWRQPRLLQHSVMQAKLPGYLSLQQDNGWNELHPYNWTPQQERGENLGHLDKTTQ